jgi:hypothetical protein
MDLDKLNDMTLAELHELARKHRIADPERLSREELTDRLGAKAGIIDRARQLVRAAKDKLLPRTATPPATPEDPETETLARLYAEQGHLARALAIYRKLAAREPARGELAKEVLRLEAALAHPREPGHPAAVPPPEVHMPAPAPTGEPLGMLDYEELPETYGQDDVAVMAQDPWHLFVYWEVTPAGRQAARSQLGGEGHAAQLTLRVSSVATRDGRVEQEFGDIDVDWDHGRRYLDAPRPGVRVTVAIGLRAPSGKFAPIAHSRTVLVPPAEPGPAGPVEWMEVAPARRRTPGLEPIVIVTRAGERAVRGAPRLDLPLGTGAASAMRPQKAGAAPDQPSSWVRWPGSSYHRPPRSSDGGGR